MQSTSVSLSPLATSRRRNSACLAVFRVAACAGSLLAALPAVHAATFTNGGGDNNYSNGANWTGGTVPDTANGATATIGNGSAVAYPGAASGDLVINNGGVLEIKNGSFTQTTGNNYLQLPGSGTVLVDGGTFNQGTVSSQPFNIGGTNNAFTVTSGTVNLNSNFNLDVGLTFLQSGGSITVTSASETRFNSTTATLGGGILTTTLITGVNGGATRFNISGGTLNLTGAGNNGIYSGGPTQFINFTPGSTGKITFSSGSTSTADVQGFVNAGVIEYNAGGTGTLSNFNITAVGGVVSISLVAVPEPSTVMLVIAGAAGLGVAVRRRRTSGSGV